MTSRGKKHKLKPSPFCWYTPDPSVLQNNTHIGSYRFRISPEDQGMTLTKILPQFHLYSVISSFHKLFTLLGVFYGTSLTSIPSALGKSIVQQYFTLWSWLILFLFLLFYNQKWVNWCPNNQILHEDYSHIYNWDIQEHQDVYLPLCLCLP